MVELFLLNEVISPLYNIVIIFVLKVNDNIVFFLYFIVTLFIDKYFYTILELQH